MLLTGRFISDEYPNVKGILSVSSPISLVKIPPDGVLCDVSLKCQGLFSKEATIRLFKDKGMLSGSNVEKDTQSFILSLNQVSSSSETNRFRGSYSTQHPVDNGSIELTEKIGPDINEK